MNEITIPVPGPMSRCWDLIRENRVWAMLNVAIWALVGLVVAAVCAWYLYAASMASLTLVDYAVVPRADGLGYWIKVHYRWSGEALRCGRQITMELWPPADDDTNYPIPIASLMQGPNLDGNTPDLRRERELPIGITPESWRLVVNVAYFCPPWRLLPNTQAMAAVEVGVP